MLDRNGEPMYEPGLINVRELLGSKDLIIYLGIYMFLIIVCDCRSF